MKSSDLIRWGGLAAATAGALFIVINLTALLSSGFGQGSLGLLVRNVISPVGGTLLVLGLVGLYARQLEAAGVDGLLGFLFALFGTGLALAGNAWANLLAYSAVSTRDARGFFEHGGYHLPVHLLCNAL